MRSALRVTATLVALFCIHLAHAVQVIPSCLPAIVWANSLSGKLPVASIVQDVPATAGLQHDHLALWICDEPRGYHLYWQLFDMGKSNVAELAWQYVSGHWTKAQADGDCRVTCTDPTPAEQAYVDPIATTYFPTASVAAAGPVYLLGTDNTRSLVPVPGVTAVAGARCVWGDRIPGTDYFAVAVDGLVLASGAPQPTVNVYGRCTVAFPLLPASPMNGQPAAPVGGIS